MTNEQFLLVIGTAIVVLLAALGIEKYRNCQTFGGYYCELGPMGKGRLPYELRPDRPNQ